MHLLRSAAIGSEVIDETDHHIHGRVSDVLIDPDRGDVLAVFVAYGALGSNLILQTHDIVSWGNRIHIRHPDVLGEPGDIIRLQPFLDDPRTVVGQRIQTKSGHVLGVCRDIQFNTKTFALEWLFPRKFLRRGIALPANAILEIREDAIIVKEQTPREETTTETSAVDSSVKPAVSPATSRNIGRT